MLPRPGLFGPGLDYSVSLQLQPWPRNNPNKLASTAWETTKSNDADLLELTDLTAAIISVIQSFILL